MIELIRKTEWGQHRRAFAPGSSGWDGQLSECRLARSPWLLFYVREAVRLPGHGFNVSSNARLGLTRGDHGVTQVLELCAPPDQWDAIAEAVAQADPLGRPVLKNARFTARWARDQFRDNDGGHDR